MSEHRRVYRKIERTPEELAELKAEREGFSRDRPSPEDLIASGDYDGPYRQGDILALLSALAALKQERGRQGLSLADVSERSGLDKAMLRRRDRHDAQVLSREGPAGRRSLTRAVQTLREL